MSGCSAQGLWGGHHLMWHMNFLEMLAMLQALKHVLPDLRGHHVLVHKQTTKQWSLISTGRHPVKAGAEARGMEAPHQGSGADLEEVRVSPGGLVCVLQCPLWFFLTWYRLGRGFVCTPSPPPHPPKRVRQDVVHLLLVAPVLARPAMVCGPGSPTHRHSMGDSPPISSLRRAYHLFTPFLVSHWGETRWYMFLSFCVARRSTAPDSQVHLS